MYVLTYIRICVRKCGNRTYYTNAHIYLLQNNHNIKMYIGYSTFFCCLVYSAVCHRVAAAIRSIIIIIVVVFSCVWMDWIVQAFKYYEIER